MEFTIKEEPFSWNHNMSEIALEDFSMIQKNLSYGTCQTIGMALAKLKLLEKQGCRVDEDKPQTNADRIRAMSDEELAEWLVNFKNTFGEEYEGKMSCLQWLQSEAEQKGVQNG